MAFEIHLGVPEMENLWNGLVDQEKAGNLDVEGKRLLRRLRQVLSFLSADPRHPSLQTQEIDALSKRYGERVWQSYLENRTPAAGRIYWIYGPQRHDITVIGLEPHPEDRKSSYARIVLSSVRLVTRSRPSKPPA
jgi:hypothetical protein